MVTVREVNPLKTGDYGEKKKSCKKGIVNLPDKSDIDLCKEVMKGKLFLSVDAAQLMRLAAEKPDAPVVTRREKEVLELIAEGYTNPEIAERLFVSVNTIDTHRRNLLEKFNVRNTASLVRMATQLQII